MHKILIALLTMATLSAASVTAIAQPCPEGQHYDAEQRRSACRTENDKSHGRRKSSEPA